MGINKLIKNVVKNFLIQENKNYSDLVLYHGTKNNFNDFDLKYFNHGSSDGGWLGYGIYLTNDYEYAESYGDVLVCNVKLENPYILKEFSYSTRPEKLIKELGVNNSREVTNKLKEIGYDSVLLTYEDNGTFIEVCVFDTSKVKILKKYKQDDDSNEVNYLRGY